MADLNDLLKQLEALSTGPIPQSVEQLKELERVFHALNEQDLSGTANASENMDILAGRIKTLQDGFAKTAAAQKSFSAGTSNVSKSIIESLGSFAAGTAGITAMGLALNAADKALNKVSFGKYAELYKAAGVKLSDDQKKSTTKTMMKTYDDLIVPLMGKQESSIATLLGGLRNTTGLLDESDLGGRFAKSAEEAQAQADGMGRAVGNTTNSFRFLKSGIDGAGEATEIFGKIANQLTDTMFTMGEDISKVSMQNLMRFRNALNVSDADMKKFGKLAAAMGTSASTQFMKVEQAATSIAKATGINRKVLATDLVKMRADFTTFGSFSAEELAKVAARAKSLGVEITKLSGLANKFDNFDSAADSMATLAQTMGVNIDAFDMFQEEDPTKQLLMIRRAFQAAGQDITQMNRKQRRMIASELGVELADVFPALSPGNIKGEELREKIDAVPEAAVKGLHNAIDKFNLSVPTQAQTYFEGLTGLMTTSRETHAELKKSTAQNRILDRKTREQIISATKGLVSMLDASNLVFSGMPNLADSIKDDTSKVMKKTIASIDSQRQAGLSGIFKTIGKSTESFGKLTEAGIMLMAADPNDPEAQKIARRNVRSVAKQFGENAVDAASLGAGAISSTGATAAKVTRGATAFASEMGREVVINLTTNLDGQPIAQSVVRQDLGNGLTLAENIGLANNPTVPPKAQPR